MGLLVVTTVTLPSLADFLSVDHGAACFDGVMGCNSASRDAPLSYVLARANKLCSVSCSFAALAARSRCRNARGSSSGLPLRTTCARQQTRVLRGGHCHGLDTDATRWVAHACTHELPAARAACGTRRPCAAHHHLGLLNVGVELLELDLQSVAVRSQRP
jgi:hypothetical protein